MYVSLNNSGSFWSLFGKQSAGQSNLSDSEIKQTLEKDYTIDIKAEGGKLYAVAKPKNVGRQKLNIAFKISVPKKVSTNLQTSNATIQISDLSGSQNLKTSNGSVTVENVSGKIAGSTSNGSVTVTNSNDDIDLRTSNGGITVKNCSGKMIFQTSNGSVNMNDLKGNISATTSNGGVTASKLNGELTVGTSNGSVKADDVSGSVNVRTSNGGITVTMVSVSDYVTLSTSNANIDLSIPALKGYNLKARADKIETSGLANFSGTLDKKNLDGRTGNGGAKIELSTSGKVNLSFN
jgi:DUF4097 and DUF4098 domain-containing protein YvlB